MFHLVCWCAAFIPQFNAEATVQSESPDCGIPHTAAATSGITDDHNADYDIQDELDLNTLAKANSSTADNDAQERTGTLEETADTPQAQSITAMTADIKAEYETPGELDANTLAKANSSTADNDVQERTGTRETADTPQAHTVSTITAINVDHEADHGTSDDLVVKTLAKAS